MKIQKSFRIIQILYAQFLTRNVLILQNVPILPNCVLLAYSSTKCFDTPILHTIDTQFYNSSIIIATSNMSSKIFEFNIFTLLSHFNSLSTINVKAIFNITFQFFCCSKSLQTITRKMFSSTM